MTDRIGLLPDHLINLIAAGEVVERPASILKELVENSLDAEASKIEIELSDGGMKSLSVLDDGTGMSPRDLVMCFKRHATSKLTDERSLGAIDTFGFRGEAIASIASVSCLEIQTRSQGSDRGFTLTSEFGSVAKEPVAIGMPSGTRVRVTRLFERLPARQKFLRSSQTELGHSLRVAREIALGNAPVKFFVKSAGGAPRPFAASTREGRVAECLKGELVAFEEIASEFQLEAYLSPAHVLSDRGELYLFVNRRSVRNRNLLSAVRAAYLDTLGPRHEPSGAVYLDIHPERVDVNVHPQKTEVRVADGHALYGWLVAAIRKHLSRPSIGSAYLSGRRHSERPLPATENSADPSGRELKPFVTAWREPAVMVSVAEPLPLYEVPCIQERRLRYLGQIRASFLVCEDALGLILVDQHALHEKFRFEELIAKVTDQKVSGQRLLVPKVIRLPSDLLCMAETATKTLSQLGMEIERLGSGDLVVRACPIELDEKNIENILVDTLRACLNDSAVPTLEKMMRPFLATVACHSVVRANQKLTDEEAYELLDQLDEIEIGWTCPHGRPCLFRLSFSEMERYFARR